MRLAIDGGDVNYANYGGDDHAGGGVSVLDGPVKGMI
jgi:hypothetical protein